MTDLSFYVFFPAVAVLAGKFVIDKTEKSKAYDHDEPTSDMHGVHEDLHDKHTPMETAEELVAKRINELMGYLGINNGVVRGAGRKDVSPLF